MKSLVVVLSFTVTAGVAASAQTVRTPVAPAPVAPVEADILRLQSAMVAAQASSITPGDEALPCEALQRELIATMTDPAIQAYAAKTNAAYAREMASQPKKGTMTADTAASLAAALNPMTMVAQQQATMNYIAQLAPIMPALMRSQRVTQLALVKNCGWMTAPALGLYPGTVIPEAVAPVRSR